ncbi:MAG: ATP-binding protein [Actinobacteria bacterium]|nr:ATP-binding protein [Actinomycetota bacterium]
MARAPEDNPFTPGFGNLPRVFAGRRHEFADLDLMVERLGRGVYEQARLVTADRGFGKTTLLREFEEEQLEAERWVVRASATTGDAVIGRLCRQLADLLAAHDLGGSLSRQAREALQRLAGLSIGPAGVSVELSPAPTADRGVELERLLAAVAQLAREHGTVLLMLVDEAQNIALDALGQLFHAIQEVQTKIVTTRDPVSRATRREALPFGVVIAGLPGLVGRLQQAGSTFGERSKPLPLAPFGDADMREGFRALVREGGADIDAEAVDVLMAGCGGYPYFFHVVGHEAWNAGTGRVVTAADAREGVAAARPLVAELYEQRLAELGQKQRDYLVAAAAVPAEERTSSEVAMAIGVSTAALGSTLQALTDRHGLLRRGAEGRLVFTLTGMDRYLAERAEASEK